MIPHAAFPPASRPCGSSPICAAGRAAFGSAKGASLTTATWIVAVAVDASGQLFWGDEPVTPQQLQAQVRDSARRNPATEVQLRADQTAVVRERRLAAAKAMLVAEPSASVLSVGLSVGFTSQSNFYEAFREIEGMTPGQYRKLNPPQKQDKNQG